MNLYTANDSTPNAATAATAAQTITTTIHVWIGFLVRLPSSISRYVVNEVEEAPLLGAIRLEVISNERFPFTNVNCIALELGEEGGGVCVHDDETLRSSEPIEIERLLAEDVVTVKVWLADNNSPISNRSVLLAGHADSNETVSVQLPGGSLEFCGGE